MPQPIRQWRIRECENTEELADKLRHARWALCTAFRTQAGVVWANYSQDQDAIQEYRVFREVDNGDYEQFGFVTVTFCNLELLRQLIEQADHNDLPPGLRLDGLLEREYFQSDHAPCPACG